MALGKNKYWPNGKGAHFLFVIDVTQIRLAPNIETAVLRGSRSEKQAIIMTFSASA